MEIPTLNDLFRHVRPQPCVAAVDVAENVKQFDVVPPSQLTELRSHADSAFQLILGGRGVVAQILPISSERGAVFGYCGHGTLHGRGVFMGPDSMELYFPKQSICVHSQGFEVRDTESCWAIIPRVNIAVELGGDEWTRSRIVWGVRIRSEYQLRVESVLLHLQGILMGAEQKIPESLAQKSDQLFRERMDSLGLKEKSNEIIRLAMSGSGEDIRWLCAILSLDACEVDQLIEVWSDFTKLGKAFHSPAVVDAQCTLDVMPYDEDVQWERGKLKVYVQSRLGDVEPILAQLCCAAELDIIFGCIADLIASSCSLRTQEAAWRKLANRSVLQTLDMDMGF